MQNIFLDARDLDKAARENFNLTEDIMMENAARALEDAGSGHFFSPDNKYINRPTVLVLAGGGNNGADGCALARRIVQKKLCVLVCQVYEPKTELCRAQAERAKKAGAIFISPYDLDEWIERASFDLRAVYDCIFGSGFHGTLDATARAVLESANKIDGAYKIACDIPTGAACLEFSGGQDIAGGSGIAKNLGQGQEAAGAPCPAADSSSDKKSWQNKNAAVFMADKTVAMGALRPALFSDAAKDAVGKIAVAELGISRSNYENAALFQSGAPRPCARLLEESDARLPFRGKRQNSNKGTFGHTAIFAGTRPGAAVIAGRAALKFGSGLSTLVARGGQKIQFENVADFALMLSDAVPQNASAIVAGPGLGRPIAAGGNALSENSDSGKNAADLSDGALFEFLRETPLPLVLDADIFYYPQIRELLEQKRNVVLTPHPKEFSALLENCALGSYSVPKIVGQRFALVQKFAEAFPGAVLLLKGANVAVASKIGGETNPRVYVNALGTSALAKAGSGDVLSGMIGALLAQGRSPLEAAVSASIRHAAASRAFDKKDYALSPFDLIEAI